MKKEINYKIHMEQKFPINTVSGNHREVKHTLWQPKPGHREVLFQLNYYD